MIPPKFPLQILLTNDDGIDAPGLAALVESVQHAMAKRRPDHPYHVTVVAPDRCRSECGHSIETGRPVSVSQVSAGRYSVDGTPVDCIRVAYYALQLRPHLVLSGINAGANLGVNLMVSGTFAAAREASLLGLPAMAASHYRRPDVPKTWQHAPRWLEQSVDDFLSVSLRWHAETENARRRDAPLWNVNLPAVEPTETRIPERVVCEVDRCPIDRKGAIGEGGRVIYELDFHGRPREPGRDVDHCFAGRITLSEVHAHTVSADRGDIHPSRGSAR